MPFGIVGVHIIRLAGDIMKKRRSDRRRTEKIREMGIVFTVAETTTVTGVTLGPDGTLMLVNEDGPIKSASAAVEWSYARPKGRKVLFRAPVDASAPTINPHAHLLSYAAVIAVDTNSRRIDGEDVSVTAVTQAIFAKDAESTVMTSRPLCAVELRGLKAAAEKVGWHVAIDYLLQAPGVSEETQIALVVDAHLGEIDGINTRSQGIVEGRMLPPPFTLVYASDAAADSVMNDLIRDCHKDANNVLRLIESGQTTRRLIAAPEVELYSHSRWWTWNPSSAA